MNLMQSLLENPAIAQQLASRFGLEGEKAQQVLTNLVPTLAQGVQAKLQGGGIGALIGLVQDGFDDVKAVESPELVSTEAAAERGNYILETLLGGNTSTNNIAEQAAGSVGLDSSTLQKMVPVLATMLLGVITKQGLGQAPAPGATADAAPGANPLLASLTSYLDSDKDGSVVDDMLKMANKLF
ncbi:MAG: DUF937 domain-containing protein [Bdellovibrionales bacterium]|nr:DUF937 domain-containing protein [Bdellovibrionales bacterium]